MLKSIEGKHRVVVRVDFNELNEKKIENQRNRSQEKQVSAYCRFTLNVIADKKETADNNNTGIAYKSKSK